MLKFLARGEKMNILNKLYCKSNLWFSIAWIIAYCLLMSVGDGISATLGVEKAVSLPVALCMMVILLLFLKKNQLFSTYGLRSPDASVSSMLFYIPVMIMLTANTWSGLSLNYSVLESILYILTMFCVGFLEEVIFRGLLFGAMAKDSPRAAIIVSSLTFGIGHIINLINGSGAELIPNILQIIYATAAGFMFVMIYLKSGSLVGCILTHSVFNALSAFQREPGLEMQIVTCILLTIITGGYGFYLALSMKKEKKEGREL